MKKLFIALSLAILLSLTAQKYNDSYLPYDKKLAVKYGLEIPEQQDQLDPVPEWLRNADLICRFDRKG